MDRSWYLRFSVVLLAVVLAWLTLWPSVSQWVPAPEWVTAYFDRRISPGLDIRGGLRLQYEVEVDEAVRDRRDTRGQQLIERLGQAMELFEEGDAPTREQLTQIREHVRVEAVGERQMRLIFSDAADMEHLTRDLIRSFGDIREVSREGTRVLMELKAESIEQLQDTSVQQARETIANRIDEMGLREASVLTRDTDIIVEVPGADQSTFDHIREIIARTARLEFKIVDDESDFVQGLRDLPEGIERASEVVSAGEDRPAVASYYLFANGDGACPEGVTGQGVAGEDGTPQCTARQRLTSYIASLEVPDGHELVLSRYEVQEEEEGQPQATAEEEANAWRTFLLFDRAEVTGDYISDAQVAIDSQDNKPYVSLNFDGQGARVFERLTGSNVKRRMAIVLDDRVETAPVIQTRIGGGRCQITLGGYRDYNSLLNEANELVIVLRAGALPAPIRPANEQLIGPTLGRDSVARGAQGALIGIALVLLFMAIYYQVAGLVADLMVVLNVLFLLAILAFFEGTLTLPGIAGIALTVGMAVDANVLINERIREELRLGKSARAAVDQGFSRAFSSIFDSQITTFIAGVVLAQYGTGPIRGFAYTLMIGIVTSLFTGVFCSRVMFDWLVRGLRVQNLRVG